MGSEAPRQADSCPPFSQVGRSCCSCICGRRSSSPNCSKTPTAEINRLQQERFPGDINGYGFSSSYWRAQQASMPYPHSGSCHLPRTSIPDGTPVGSPCTHEGFPASTWFSPSSFNQKKGQEQKKVTVESIKGYGARGAQSNEITLYRWYLSRIGSSESVEVSVGGFFGTVGLERFETSAIVQRLEKCRLLAQDGVEVRLAGLIDDHTTVSNGFSLNLVQSFLSGFPYTWNHLLENELHMSITNGRDHQLSGDCRSGAVVEMSRLSFEGCCSDQERKVPSSTLKEVSRHHLETGNDIGLNGKQSVIEGAAEKESKILDSQSKSKESEKSEAGTLKDDQVKNSNLTGSVEQDIHDSSNITMVELQASDPVEQSKCNIKEKTGRGRRTHVNREQVDTANAQIDAGNTSFAQLNHSPRITRSMRKISCHAASSENNHSFSDGFNAIPQYDTHNNCKNLVQTPEEDFRPCLESRFYSFSSPLIQESVGEDRQPARRLLKKNNKDKVDGGQTPNRSPCHHSKDLETPVEVQGRSLDAEATLASRDGPAIVQEENFVIEDVPDNVCNTETEKEDLPMFVQNSEVMGTEEFKTNSKNARKIKASNEEGTLSTSSSRQNSKRLEENFVMEDLPDNACNTEAEKEDLSMLVQNSEVMGTEALEANSKNSRKIKALNEEGRLPTSSSRQYSKRSITLPPLPCPRVPIAKHLISTAFGLKTSRSGRLLVPPLAHWCGQSLLRDKDGGIIAISDGSKDMNNDGAGSFKFKPPAEKRLQKLQKRLCEVAIDRTPSKKRRSIGRKSC